MRVVPQAFYESSSTRKIMVDGLSCVIEKKVNHSDSNNERYLAAHALTLVTSGRLLIETAENGSFSVNAGEYVLLPRGLYMITDIVPAESKFLAIVYFFAEEIVTEFLKNNQFSESKTFQPSLFIDQQSDDLKLFTQTLLAIYGERSYNPRDLTQQKLYELLHLLCNGVSAEEFRNQLLELRKREKISLRNFMESNFQKRLDVADYAYLTGRSSSTFQRDFKRVFGVSPKQWLTVKRMEHARHLLQNQQYTTGEIGIQLGYDNLSHFVRTFRKQYGITPKQYQINFRRQSRI